MRFSWTLVALIVLVAIRIVLTRLRRKRNSPSDQQPTKRDARPETYSGLRNLILQGSRQKFGLPPASPAEPYGVLMDWGVSSGTASVVAMADGTATIYFSSGGGYLAGFQVVGTVRDSPIPGKLKIYSSDDLDTWHEMPVDYRADAHRAIIAAPDPDHVWVATDTGMILKLEK